MPEPSSVRLLTLLQRAVRFLAAPSRRVEIAAWLLLAAVLVAVRAYMVHLLPGYLWSRDAIGYAYAPLHWMESGDWERNPKRGSVYSLLIGLCLKVWGTMDAVMIVQHVLGALASLAVVLLLRVMHGRVALWPAVACGLALAVHGEVLYLEHLIRNDILLFALAGMIFAAWWLALRRESAVWLGVSGAAVGLLMLARNVLGPVPLFILAAEVWRSRHHPGLALRRGAVFAAGVGLPFLAMAVFNRCTRQAGPKEPQPGTMFFARVAQFAVLDGGIEREIKELIRPDIEAYRRLGKLDNNVILNRTAVPRLRQHFRAIGRTPTDLDRLCWRLGVEAVRAHPQEYARQVWSDFLWLQLDLGSRQPMPSGADIRASAEHAKLENIPALRAEENTRRLEPGFHNRHLDGYRRVTKKNWLFWRSPGLLTSLGVSLLAALVPGKMRWWWVGAAVFWWFTIALLCTIGRPLARYLLPVLPIMFWTLGTFVTLGWIRLLAASEKALAARALRQAGS